MGKEVAAAGRLPPQGGAEGGRFNGNHYQVLLSAKMARSRFLDLMRSGKVNETIPLIDFGAAIKAFLPRGCPLGFPTYLEDEFHRKSTVATQKVLDNSR